MARSGHVALLQLHSLRSAIICKAHVHQSARGQLPLDGPHHGADAPHQVNNLNQSAHARHQMCDGVQQNADGADKEWSHIKDVRKTSWKYGKRVNVALALR